MRMIYPGIRERRTIDRQLTEFFRRHAPSKFRRAIRTISHFYHLRTPKVDWFEYLDWGKGAGRTLEDGKIFLVHPENWKRNRKYKSERQWIQMVYHEMGHYVLWADAERKADQFAYKFIRGVSSARNGKHEPASRRGEGALTQSRLHRRRRRSRSR